jgi:phospholipid transport system transporter-binding protein
MAMLSLTLPATTTIDQVPALREEWASHWSEIGSDGLQVQAAELKAFDTSTLALLLEAQRRVKLQGGEFVVHGAPAKLVELAKLYGVEALVFTRALPAETSVRGVSA